MPRFQLTTIHKVALAVSIPVSAALLYFLLYRDEEEEEEPPKRVVTSRQTVIEVKVPREVVGAVIGTKGSQIKQIQEESGARVNFKDDNDPESDRFVIIRGNHESAQQAELLIRKIIAEQPTIDVETIYVPQTAMGRIIGRNGENIREAARISKAKIVADRSDDRRKAKMVKIEIKGSTQAIANAKALLQEKVEEEEAYRAKVAVAAANRQPRGRARVQNDGAGDASGAPPKPPPEFIERPANLNKDWPHDTVNHYPVYVSAVQHPGHFWIQLINSQSTRLDKLTDEMTLYYDNPVNKETCRPERIEKGSMLAAPFLLGGGDDKMYRVMVEEVLDDGRILDLYYVDYGDNGEVATHLCYTLGNDFQQLPYQAFECCIAGIKTKDGHDDWDEEAIVAFEDLVHVAQWKPIQLRTCGYLINQIEDETSPTPRVELVDTNGDSDVNIAAELVRLGWAVWDTEPEQVAC